MDASCASREMSTTSFRKFVLQEMCKGGKMIHNREREVMTNMSAAAGRGEGAELSRDMYSVLRSHETFADMGGVPDP